MSYLRNYSSCTIEKNIVEELGIIEEQSDNYHGDLLPGKCS
jgi:hypothetical protein